MSILKGFVSTASPRDAQDAVTASSRRQHPRFALEAAVEIRGAVTFVSGRTKDVSRGGLAALVPTPIATGTEVELAISLVFDEDTFSEPLLLPARVVWCTPLGEARHQLGTAFLPLSRDQAEFLSMFLRYLREADRMEISRNGSGGRASNTSDPD